MEPERGLDPRQQAEAMVRSWREEMDKHKSGSKDAMMVLKGFNDAVAAFLAVENVSRVRPVSGTEPEDIKSKLYDAAVKTQDDILRDIMRERAFSGIYNVTSQRAFMDLTGAPFNMWFLREEVWDKTFDELANK